VLKFCSGHSHTNFEFPFNQSNNVLVHISYKNANYDLHGDRSRSNSEYNI
jgi:hypothetical protein